LWSFSTLETDEPFPEPAPLGAKPLMSRRDPLPGQGELFETEGENE